MTLAVDPSALVRRYVRGPGHGLVTEAMADDRVWCASALARSETLQALHQLAVTPGQHDHLWRSLRADWDAFHVVPVDGRCLSRAAEIGATFGVGTVDAIHLAAADRLPRPVRYLTFDRRQVSAAVELGLEVVSPVVEG